MKRLLALIALTLFPISICQAQDDASGQDMMAEWMKYASPGEHHKMLEPMVGTFDVTGKFRMSPDSPWSTSTSESTAEWILGGRFVQSHVRAEADEMMPDPFEGIGLMGYDNYQQKYVMTWVDNHGTLIITGSGGAKDDAISIKGTYADPISKSDKTFRWVYRLTNSDAYVMEMYEPLPDGGEFMSAEITYDRSAK